MFKPNEPDYESELTNNCKIFTNYRTSDIRPSLDEYWCCAYSDSFPEILKHIQMDGNIFVPDSEA